MWQVSQSCIPGRPSLHASCTAQRSLMDCFAHGCTFMRCQCHTSLSSISCNSSSSSRSGLQTTEWRTASTTPSRTNTQHIHISQQRFLRRICPPHVATKLVNSEPNAYHRVLAFYGTGQLYVLSKCAYKLKHK